MTTSPANFDEVTEQFQPLQWFCFLLALVACTCLSHSVLPRPFVSLDWENFLSDMVAQGAVRWEELDHGSLIVLVNWLYFCAIMMVNSGYLSLEKILPPQVVSSLLEGPKELGHPPHRLNRYVA